MMHEATLNSKLLLDVKKCMELLLDLENTFVFDCTKAKVYGAVCDTLKGVSGFQKFVADLKSDDSKYIETISMFRLSDSTTSEARQFKNGKLIDGETADKLSARRKAKRNKSGDDSE
jgi:hypothetical protein